MMTEYSFLSKPSLYSKD